MPTIAKQKHIAAGNPWSRNPVIVASLTEERSFSPAEVRRLLRAMGRQRPDARDFPAWRRLATARDPVAAEEVLAILAVLLQRTMYWPVKLCALDGPERLVFETRSPNVGRAAARAAGEVVGALAAGVRGRALAETFDATLSAFQKRVARRTPGFDAFALARAAEARGIHWTSIPDSNLLRLGTGRHAKVVRGSESSDTSVMGKTLAKKKHVTSAMLSAAGIPVPPQKVARSMKSALRAYVDFDRDVVVKPAKGKQGKGVTVRPGSALGLARAYRRAAAVSRPVVIEAFAPGEECRLLVVDGHFRAASKRRPARVVGDGTSSIRALVEGVNADPIRRPMPSSRHAVRVPIRLDAAAIAHLARQGFTPESVPEAGAAVEIFGISNVSRGGDAVDVSDSVHPEVRRIAERSARILNIDLCGIDYLSADVTRAPGETGGCVVEANTMPGLSLHLVVAEGRARDVAGDYIAKLFPEGTRGQVPVVAIVDNDASTGLLRGIAAAVRRRGLTLGVQGGDELFAGGQPLDATRLPSADAVCWEHAIDCAAIVVSARRVIGSGLGLNRVDLAVLPADDGRKNAASLRRALVAVSANGLLPASDTRALDRIVDILCEPVSPPAEPVRPTAAGPATEASAGGEAAFVATFVGDIGFGEAYKHYPKCQDLQRILDVEGYDHCQSELRPLLDGSDMVVGNLEVPLAPRPDERLRGRKKFLGWCEPRRTLKALVSGRFAALSLANNHALDCGDLGLAATLEQLERAGIAPFGAGASRGLAERPIVRRVSVGRRIRNLVVFAGFEHRDRYATKFRWYAGDRSVGVARLDPGRIAAQVEFLRGELENPVFVAFPHWGLDYRDVTHSQRDLAGSLVAAGMDAVIGHGTHCCQRIEAIDGRPVVYGLGNFVWNAPQSGFSKYRAPPFGLVAELVLGEADGFGLRLQPIVTDRAMTNFQNRPVTDREFDAVVEAVRPGAGWTQDRDGSGRSILAFAGRHGALRADPRRGIASMQVGLA